MRWVSNKIKYRFKNISIKNSSIKNISKVAEMGRFKIFAQNLRDIIPVATHRRIEGWKEYSENVRPFKTQGKSF